LFHFSEITNKPFEWIGKATGILEEPKEPTLDEKVELLMGMEFAKMDGLDHIDYSVADVMLPFVLASSACVKDKLSAGCLWSDSTREGDEELTFKCYKKCSTHSGIEVSLRYYKAWVKRNTGNFLIINWDDVKASFSGMRINFLLPSAMLDVKKIKEKIQEAADNW